MKRRLTPGTLAMHLHRPIRFGSAWRGHELPLRMIQLVLILFLAVMGAQFIAHMVSGVGQALVGLFS